MKNKAEEKRERERERERERVEALEWRVLAIPDSSGPFVALMFYSSYGRLLVLN